MYSVCTVNKGNLDHLRVLLSSLRKNSKYSHELIVHDNFSDIEVKTWAQDNGITYSSSSKDLGYGGINRSLKLATFDYVYIVQADSYFFPEWDTEIERQILHYKKFKVDDFIISSHPFHPWDTPDARKMRRFKEEQFEHFDEEVLLARFIRSRSRFFDKFNTIGYNVPMLLPRDMVRRMGYIDTEYPNGGIGVHHDIAARAYFRCECRHFIKLPRSRVHCFSPQPPQIDELYAADLYRNKWGKSTISLGRKLRINHLYTDWV